MNTYVDRYHHSVWSPDDWRLRDLPSHQDLAGVALRVVATVALLAFFCLSASAACTYSPGVGTCTFNTDPVTSGSAFQAYINAMDCGDTVNLDPEAGSNIAYETLQISQQYFTFPYKNTTACNAGGSYVTIKSSATCKTANARVGPGDLSNMAVLQTGSSGGGVGLFSALAQHYKFICIAARTTSLVNTNAGLVPYLFTDDKGTVTGPGTYPHDIWFEQCLFYPAEAATVTPDNPFISASKAINIEGIEIKATNSYMYGFLGMRTDIPVRTVTSVTQSTTPDATSGSAYGGHPPGDALGVWIFGATGNWDRINGYTRAIADNGTTTFFLQYLCDFIVVSGGNVATCVNQYNRTHHLRVGDHVTISGVTYPGAGGLNGYQTITAIGTGGAYDQTCSANCTFSWATSGVPNGSYCTGGLPCNFGFSGGMFAVLDTTGFGSLTGTVTWREGVPGDNDAIGIVAAPGPLRVINSYLVGWFASIFLGGGGSPTTHTATMSSVSGTGATLSTVSGLQTGDLMAVQTPYTGYLSGWRTVQISTINTMTNAVTWAPFGSSGLATAALPFTTGTCSTSGTSVTTDQYAAFTFYYGGVPIVINGVTYTISSWNGTSSLTLTGSAGTQSHVACNLAMVPSNGGTAQWDGVPGVQLEVRSNELYKPPDGYPESGVCKGMVEFKIVDGGLWDGNYYHGFPCITWGLTQRNQAGGSPWSSVRNLKATNNLSINSERTMDFQLDDDLASGGHKSQVPVTADYGGGGNSFVNNLFLDYNTYAYYSMTITGSEDTWQHNTFWRPNVSGVILEGACATTRTPIYGLNNLSAVQNNFAAYGGGGFNIDKTDCWNTYATSIQKNLVVDTGGLGCTAINTAAPNNLCAANIGAAGLAGNCDATGSNWLNCVVACPGTFCGAANDGGNPGSDPMMVQDRINQWSESEGLITYSNTAKNMVITWTPAAATSSPNFTIVNSIGVCSMHLYTDPNRATESADTSGSSACNRAGNTVVGSNVTAMFGHVSPLSANTAYYYLINDGSRQMVGSFTTASGGGTGGATVGGNVTVGGNMTRQ